MGTNNSLLKAQRNKRNEFLNPKKRSASYAIWIV